MPGNIAKASLKDSLCVLSAHFSANSAVKCFEGDFHNYLGGIGSILSRMRTVSRMTVPLMFRLFTLSLSTVS